jgi:zinc protease
VDGRAHRLGWALAVHGGLDAELRHEAEMERLSPAGVRAVAARWLRPDRGVLAVLAPAADLDAPVDSLLPDAGLAAVVPAAVGEERVRFRLENGLQVVIQPEPDAGTVAFALHGVGGSLLETPGTAGLSTAWGRLLTRGAGPLDAAAFSGALGDLSSVVWGWGGRSTGGVAASGPAEAAEALLRLLADVALAPRFDPDERARLRADLREEQALAADDPAGLAFDSLVSTAWAAHPWGHPELGTPASVRAIGAAALRAMHRAQMVGENLVLAVTGAVEPREIEAWVRRAFRRLPAGHRQHPAPPVGFAGGQRVERRLARAGAPTAVCIGFPGPGLFAADEPVYRVLRGILSGATGGGGRLFHQLREVRGLCYSVGASLQSGLGGGLFTCQVEADPARADEAEAALWAELDALAGGGPLPELDRVKQGIVEGLVLEGQRASARAERLAEAERFGPGADAAEAARSAVAQVGAAQVRAVARALRRENAVTVRVSAEAPPPRGRARRRAAPTGATLSE